MLQIMLFLAILVSALSLTTEGNKHQNIIGTAEAQLIPEHEDRNSRSYQLIYPNHISQYPSSKLFGSGGYSNNLYYSPTQGRVAEFTDTRRSDVSSIYRFLYPDENQQVYPSRLPIKTWNTQSDTKVQAVTPKSQIPKYESMTGEIKPTNRLLNPGQNEQELPVHSGRTQSDQASTKDLNEVLKEQQIKPTNSLLNPGQNRQELPVHSSRAQSETKLNVEVSPKDQQIKPTNRLMIPGQNQQELLVHSNRAQDGTNLIVQASTKDPKKELEGQKIKPTNRLFDSGQNQNVQLDELSVQTGKFKNDVHDLNTNVQENYRTTPKDESRIHQIKLKNKKNKSHIKKDEIKKQKEKPQPLDNLEAKVISVTNNLPNTKPSSTLPENNSPTKDESSIIDHNPTTIKPQSSTASANLFVPTKKPFIKHQKKHHEDIIDQIFYSFFSSEEI